MFVCLDIHNEHQRVVVLYLFHSRLCSQGELDDGIVIQPKEQQICTFYLNGYKTPLLSQLQTLTRRLRCISRLNMESFVSYFDRYLPSFAPGLLLLAVARVTYLFLRGALLRGYLGCLRRRRVLGRRKVGEVRIFFLLWLWTPLSTAFLAFRAFDLASVLAGTTKTERKAFFNDRPLNLDCKKAD